MVFLPRGALAALVLALVGCSQAPSPWPPPSPVSAPPGPAATAPANPSDPAAVAAAISAAEAPSGLAAGPAPAAPKGGPVAPDPAIIKAEVLLERAHASPGVIDGLPGTNLQRAVAAFQAMQGLPSDGQLTADVWSRLQPLAQAPVAGVYTVTAEDAAGPFYPDVGDDMVAASKLPTPGYTSAAELIAAKFHMSESLLAALNPGKDPSQAGVTLVVASPATPALAQVARMEIDKAGESVRAYDDHGAMIASFPATIGSAEHPSPTGDHKVVGVQLNPTYTYDPAKLTWGPKSHGKFVIRPVGLVWIGLNAPGYGVHGSPSPDKIAKTASHGCVRLTNWDALLLAGSVKPGVEVDFVKS